MTFKSIGKSRNRVDGIEKATGEAKFLADLRAPHALTVKLLRSPHGHAYIENMDIADALRVPGVVKIVTGAECAYRTGTIIRDIDVMAVKKVRYAGEVVAAVIAEKEAAASQAVEAINVSYRELDTVTDVLEASEKKAPLVHEEKGSNIFHHYRLRKGDVADGFKKADLIVENSFSVPHVSHTSMEAHGAIACWTSEGLLDITTSSQAPFLIKQFLAEMLDISQNRVRIRVPAVGGGFGGKSDMTIEPLIACLAKQVPGRTIRLVLSREETFCGSLLGRGMSGTIKTGVTRDGVLTAEEITMYFNAGAYGDFCLPIVCGGGQNAPGPYLNDNIKVDAYGVYTNTPYVGAFRGYGHPEGNWMKERQLDIIARKLSMDPVELRLRNCWKKDGINHVGQKIEGGAANIGRCIERASKAIDWASTVRSEGRDTITAKGIAAFMKAPVMATNGFSTSILKFNNDGSVNISVGTIDIGQGSITALTQICSEKLGIPEDEIHLARDTDTQFSAYEWQTVASRGTWSVGNAIISACDDAIRKIKTNASYFFRVPPDRIVYDNGTLFVSDKPAKKHPLKEFVNGYMFKDGHTLGGPVVGYGYFVPDIQIPDPVTGQGRVAAEWTGGCQAAEIEIDKRTGEISVRKFVTVIDAGTIVNPSLARGQIVGAVVQGLGQALLEKIVYAGDGTQRTHHFTDYKIPTPEDLWDVDMEVIFLDTYEENAPFGARCLGEHGIVSVPAVIANAVRQAVDLDITDIPVSCDTILEHIKSGRPGLV